LLSRTAVSQVTERLWQEYEAFATRDLSEFQLAYLFVDGVAERLHAGMPREAVLCAWGITEDGRKVLLHLAPGTKEDTASCTAFFEDLKRRGLPDPLLAPCRSSGAISAAYFVGTISTTESRTISAASRPFTGGFAGPGGSGWTVRASEVACRGNALRLCCSDIRYPRRGCRIRCIGLRDRSIL